jgi:hypothetical protein
MMCCSIITFVVWVTEVHFTLQACIYFIAMFASSNRKCLYMRVCTGFFSKTKELNCSAMEKGS